MRLYIVLVILFFASIGNAQNVHIKGKSLSYRGKTLSVFSYKDFISELPQKLAETKVDTNGHFQFQFTVNSITKIYIPTGFYTIEYMVYPGAKEEVLFPRFKNKPKDMYFVPVKVWAKNKSKDPEDLNNLIFNFEMDLGNLTEQNINRIKKKDESILKNIIPYLNKKYASKNEFFNTYKKYSFAQTSLTIDRDNPNKIINTYFKGKDIHVNNTAYTKVFKDVFYKYVALYQFKKKEKLTGELLYNKLFSLIEKKGITNKDISNYIILHILHDACYSPVLKQKLVFETLDYFRLSCGNDKQKMIAANILAKSTRLAEGYTAPIVEGYDLNGNVKKSNDKPNKYIYLIFYEPSNPRCMKDLKTIAKIASRNSFLEVIFVCDISKKSACINELKNMKLHNNALFCENIEKVKEMFQVIVYPSYFLIDKDGTFIKSHTAKPDGHLYKSLNQINIKEIREGNIPENKYFK